MTLEVDFTAGARLHRLRSGAGRGGALARAVGARVGVGFTVVDATAGLGRDAFVLASLGHAVVMMERVPVVHAALEAAIARACASDAPLDVADAVGRLTLMAGDARVLLPGLSPDVVLVDPMHPPRSKSALVKADMRQLRSVVGDDADSAELVAVALATARRRVVLKWPLRAPPLPQLRRPSHSITGQTTRYDVFLTG